MSADDHYEDARRSLHPWQESATSLLMDGVLSSPSPLQQPFPLPQSWPLWEQVDQEQPARLTFDPSWEQIGDITRANQHSRNLPLHSSEQALALQSIDYFTSEDGRITIRQQQENSVLAGAQNAPPQRLPELPPNRVLDFGTVSQLDGLLNPDPSPLPKTSSQREVSFGQRLTPQRSPVPRRQAAYESTRRLSAGSVKQESCTSTRSSPTLPDPYVHNPTNDGFEPQELISLPSIAQMTDHNRPTKIGDEVHILDPQHNARSGVVTYTVTDVTPNGMCSVRPTADLVVPIQRLLRTRIPYLSLATVFQPQLHTKNGKQEIRSEEVNYGHVTERTVVGGNRKYTVVNCGTGQTYKDLDDSMIGSWSWTDEQADELFTHVCNGDELT